MSITTTVLFQRPQQEIATLIRDRLSRSVATRIVTGFATPGGLAEIGAPIRANPGSLETFVIGASTYPGFQALDNLLAAGVPVDRLHVHLGFSAPSGTPKNPVVRYHPMLHSKVYYMELPASSACAFIGSHNVTAFALGGSNGEASVLIEGDMHAPEFAAIRSHVDEAQRQATPYSPTMKEGFSWWFKEYVEGLKAEIRIPTDWVTVRTILAFSHIQGGRSPRVGETIYFEIPAGIEEIESLKTEVHLFLYGTMPADPMSAINAVRSASRRYTCQTIGVENGQGNREVSVDWVIDGSWALTPVPSATFRPSTPAGMQQVRAKVVDTSLPSYEYAFERERTGWDPVFSEIDVIDALEPPLLEEVARREARGGRQIDAWRLVSAIEPRSGAHLETDQKALNRAIPESGAFILVSLRRRRSDSKREG
ncbi:hypothetical protein AU381_08005 [Sinorhizobium glycinis]|uniref:Phospholipase D-like domain-containing protein n=1 Tax=Sinorhizobium glycinis TaxID=1472378 RepID=A0A178XUR5_9HYPH|nr:phospholipase D-like domain-containing protein [Sinorhizobium glycinis]OAP39039.1 hypothetical protein AU381_08005 [Sinorhizobium glycinis]